MDALLSAAGLSPGDELEGLLDWVPDDLLATPRARSSPLAHSYALLRAAGGAQTARLEAAG